MEACNAGDGQHVPVHRRRRRLGRLVLVQLRRHLDAADLHRPDRPQLHGRGRRQRPAVRAADRADRHAAELRRAPAWSPTATRRWRSGRATGGGGVLVGQRLAAVLREPDLGASRARAPFKGAEAIAVSHTDDIAGGGGRRQRRLVRAGDRQQAERRAVLRQGADLGRQRRSRARSSATSTSATPRSAATAGQPNQPLDRVTSTQRRHDVDREAGHAGDEQHPQPQRLRAQRLHGAHGLARRRLRVRLPVRLRRDDRRGGPDPDDQVDRRRHALEPPGQHHPRRSTPATRSSRRSAVASRTASVAPAATSRPRRRSTSPTARPPGTDATNRMVISWVDGRDGLEPRARDVQPLDERRRELDRPGRDRAAGVDRGYYSAPAISPDGQDVWVVYNAFTTPFRNNATDWRTTGSSSASCSTRTGRRPRRSREVHRGAVGRRARLVAERPRRRVPR